MNTAKPNENFEIAMIDHFVIKDKQTGEILQRGRGIRPMPIKGEDE